MTGNQEDKETRIAVGSSQKGELSQLASNNSTAVKIAKDTIR